jgi:hypothetical protein
VIFLHVSELAIDRLLAGELPDDHAAALRDHAASCARCGVALEDAVQTRRAFAAEPPPRWLPRRASRAVPYVAAAATALVATLAVVVAWPHEPARDAVRTKGAALAGFFVAHGDAVRRGAARELVAPGDRIALYTTTTEPAWFAATSVDGVGTRSVYVAPRVVAAGAEQVLPMSIVLDDAPGTEVVTAAFCAEPFDPFAPPSGCTIERFTLVKVRR